MAICQRKLCYITTSTTTYNFTYDVFGNSSNVSAGSNVLASYTYNDYNGKLSELTYGNGHKVKYVYDELDRTSEILYNTGSGGTFETVCKYEYDSGGRPQLQGQLEILFLVTLLVQRLLPLLLW